MRLCPSIEGSASPLITHRIGADVCLARQATNFHKCHRCVYRGQAAEWVAEDQQDKVIELPENSAKKSGPSKVVIPRSMAEDEQGIAANG